MAVGSLVYSNIGEGMLCMVEARVGPDILE